MRNQGVEAEATPRRSRGVVKKADKSVIKHIERGDKTHKPRASKIKAAQIKEAAVELVAETEGRPINHKPWEAKIKATQTEIRGAWLTAASQIKQVPIKEHRNERPDYNNINAERARRGHRAAALYQSGIKKPGPATSARSIASLRNVSRIGLVHDERADQMFLYEDAFNRLGRLGTPGPDVRRSGISADGDDRKRSLGQQHTDDVKSLSEQIKGFVGRMPPIDTAQHELKASLIKQFTRQREQEKGVVDADKKPTHEITHHGAKPRRDAER